MTAVLLILSSGLILVLLTKISCDSTDKNRYINLFFTIGLLFSFLFVFHILSKLIFPLKVQEVELPLKILNENRQVEIGDYLIIEINTIKYVNQPSVVQATILCEDGSFYNYSPITSNAPKGEQKLVVKNAIRIPNEAHPAQNCQLFVIDTFRLNSLRTFEQHQYSEFFDIIGGT